MKDFNVLLNTQNIVSITKHEKLQYRSIAFKKEEKFLGFITQKEGFYENEILAVVGPMTAEQVVTRNKKIIVEGTQTYYKPHLDFKMSTGAVYSKFFESFEELNLFIINNYPLLVNFIRV